MPARLEVDGRLTLAGPRGAQLELVGHGDRVELRCDRLRSLAGVSSLAMAVRRLVGETPTNLDSRSLPALSVVVRGQRIAEIDGPSVARLITSRGSLASLATTLPGIRFAGLFNAAVRRGGASPGGSPDQSSST